MDQVKITAFDEAIRINPELSRFVLENIIKENCHTGKKLNGSYFHFIEESPLSYQLFFLEIHHAKRFQGEDESQRKVSEELLTLEQLFYEIHLVSNKELSAAN